LEIRICGTIYDRKINEHFKLFETIEISMPRKDRFNLLIDRAYGKLIAVRSELIHITFIRQTSSKTSFICPYNLYFHIEMAVFLPGGCSTLRLHYYQDSEIIL